MKLFARILMPVAAISLLGMPACGKKPAPQPAADVAKAPEADVAKAPEADVAVAPAPDTAPAVAADTAPAAAADAAPAGDAAPVGDGTAAADAVVVPTDYVRVVVPHNDPAKGPVTADFKTFKIVEANIDLTKLETAKAVIEVDANSFESGIADRNTHVKSADFLDIAKFATFTITVDRLKAVENMADTFDATATIDLHGIKKEVPVQFKVVEKKTESIVIEGEVKDLARADWGMALPADKVNVADKLTGQIRIELKNVTPEPTPAPKPE